MAEFDQDFEDEILAQCLRDSEYVRRASATLDAHHFGTEQHGWVWTNIKDVWESHGELLHRGLIIRRARSDFKDEDERMAVLELASKLFRLKPSAPKAALEELENFVRFVNLHTAFEESLKHVDKGNLDEAYSIIHKTVSVDRRPTGYEISHWIEEFSDRLKQAKQRRDNPNEHPVIKTGIKGLDKIIMGIRLTEFGLLAATTNRGKSITGVHFGFHAINQKFGTAHFSTEMNVEQVAMRYDSRWSRLVHAKFKVFDFNTSELRTLARRLAKAKDKYKGLLKIISIPVTSARLPQMRRVVDELDEQVPGGIRLVILDSPDHIRGDTNQRERRHEIGDVFWDVAGWAAEDKRAIWGTTQLGKQAADRVGKSEDVADNYDKARIADIFLTLNRPVKKSRATPKVEIGEDEDEKGDAERVEKATGVGGDLELQLAKYRDGAADVRIPLHTDLKRMLIRDRDEDD